MTTTWDTIKIASLLSSAFAPHLAQQKASSAAAPTATIDVLITFDRHGVSSHPNHISVYHGARAFVASLIAGKPGWQAPVDLYTLTSVSLVRKYTSIVDMFATLVTWARDTPMRNKAHPGGLVFMSGLGAGGVQTAWAAMTTAHQSQMVWFRYAWIGLSRYMVMNDLRLEKIKTP
jgi:N-acetylglucosaminylphosphatidylinositol deacetylase